MNLFLFGYWMPEVFHLIGMSPADAVFASSLRDLGAIFAVLYLGLLIDHLGPERSLAFHYAVGSVFIAVIALVALPYLALLAVTLFSGSTTLRGAAEGVGGARPLGLGGGWFHRASQLALRADEQPQSYGRRGGAAHKNLKPPDLRHSAAIEGAAAPRRGIGDARLPVEG